MSIYTLSQIPITFNGDTSARSDMAATVLDNASVVQPFVPTGGATWTLTPGAGVHDPATDTTSYRVTFSGVPTSFIPGDAQFYFSGDATIRATEWIALAGYMSFARSVAAPVTLAGYPTEVDVQNALTAAGIVPSAAADLVGAAIAGAQDFEEATFRTMLAEASPSLRRYDPPTNPRGYLVIDDCISVASVIYQPFAGASTAFVSGQDYFLEPVNGPDRGRPYSSIRLFYGWQSPSRDSSLGTLANSIQITARWGYAAAIPQNAFQAMVARAVWYLTPAAAHLRNRGVLSWAHDGDSQSRDPGFKTLAAAMDAQYQSGVRLYKRVVFYGR